MTMAVQVLKQQEQEIKTSNIILSNVYSYDLKKYTEFWYRVSPKIRQGLY